MIRGLGLLLALVLASCAAGPPALTPGEARPPRDEQPPTRASELETRDGFGVLSDADGDTEVRALVLRFLGALADENVVQLRGLLQKATWQPGVSRQSPADELVRRFAMLDFQVLRTPLGQGTFDAMQVRVVDSASWDVRLPPLTLSEPLFLGRPVLRVVRTGEQLSIASYGEE